MNAEPRTPNLEHRSRGARAHFDVRRFLRLVCCVAVLYSPAYSVEPKPVKATPKPAATPPVKKKRGELEADEEPAVIPFREETSGKTESYSVPMPLIGTWEAAGKRLAIKDGGAYTLSGAETDAGFLHAHLGLLRRKSSRGQQWAHGRYTFRSIDAVEIEGAFGQGEWKRVR